MSIVRTLLIIDKSGTPKILSVKDYKEDELYKKCGFKKPDGLEIRHTWVIRVDKVNYRVALFAKDEGKANMENKYEFPPPVDSVLYFGTCAVLVDQKNIAGAYVPTNLSLALWDKLYEKMFGGFETLASTCKEDEDETDELESVLKSKKTMNGYLKDGFVVDSDNEDEEDEYSDVGSDEEDDLEPETDAMLDGCAADILEMDEDIGSELSEESYTYDNV
jgi:hypothetical protein